MYILYIGYVIVTTIVTTILIGGYSKLIRSSSVIATESLSQLHKFNRVWYLDTDW